MKSFTINRGVSLLEMVMAIALLGIILPSLFGLFFAHENLAEHLRLQGHMEDAAKDIKSFVKLANYEEIFNLAKSNELLAIEESFEDEVLTRKFVKCSDAGPCPNCEFLAKFEFAHSTFPDIKNLDATETCAIPLRCNIYHAKGGRTGAQPQKLAKKADMTYSTFFVKNR